MYRTFFVTHSNEGFGLSLEERSNTRDALSTLAGNLCKATGHRWCHRYGIVDDWAEKKAVRLTQAPLTREQADELSRPGAWDYLDGEDQENA